MKKSTPKTTQEQKFQINKDDREPLIDKCSTTAADGTILKCRKADGNFCSVFVSPAAKWRNGDCPLSDEFLRSKKAKETVEKTRVGQQKQKRK